MGERVSALDFLGILWYHMGVKLGCYATASHGFDSVFCVSQGGCAVAAIGWRPGRDLLGRQEKTNEFCLSCPICVSLFSAESLRDGHANLCVTRSVSARLPGKADTGGRAGEVRSGTSASRYVDGSIIPALVVGFSRAGG